MDGIDDTGVVFLSLVAASAAKVGMMYWTQKNARKNMEKVGEISAMFVHPIKSCRGWCVSEATATELGLQCNEVHDRLFMLADGANGYRHVNIKIEPTMALINPSLHGQNLHLDAPEMSTLIIPKNFPSKSKPLIDCKVYCWEFMGIDCGDEAADWFNKYLNKQSLRLLYKPESCNQRSYSDSQPFMILSTASVDDLNDKLDRYEPVTTRNFRPNLVVTGCKPFDEDNWEEICVGEAHFKRIEPCRRCTLTTIDPETGIKDSNQEPLKTLEGYRKDDEKEPPVFGSNLSVITPGKIHVGDEVFVKRKS